MLGGDLGHFDLSRGSTGLSRPSERLLIKISEHHKLHYKQCCGQEKHVHELMESRHVEMDHDYFLKLTKSGRALAKTLQDGMSGGRFFSY